MAVTGGRPRGFGAGRRISLAVHEGSSSGGGDGCDELAVSSSDSVFGFLEGSVESGGSGEGYNHEDGFGFGFEEEEEDEEGGNSEAARSFWENQHNLLQATLCRTTSVETGIRSATKEALNEIQGQGDGYCKCDRKVAAGSGCRACLLREVSGKLRNAGYDCAVCRSKWRSSPEIPSGEHTFLDVIDSSNPRKGEVRVIVELNFRAEFEMARASEEYSRLVSRLPEVFVAKVERLRALIKVLCAAAKKCMKDKKMHMGPWRKQKYVLAKWFGGCERVTGGGPSSSLDRSDSRRASKPARASLLTMALLESMPRKAVAVV